MRKITQDTSSIYGETVIVVSYALYEHYRFYIQHFRAEVSDPKSTHVFIPASRNTANMSQSNTTASLTSSFKLSNEYQRLCCTRVLRLWIASLACNDGGFDSGLFAHHFMTHWKVTTNLHYNLLPNHRQYWLLK